MRPLVGIAMSNVTEQRGEPAAGSWLHEDRGLVTALLSFALRAGAVGGGLLGAVNQLALQVGPEPGPGLGTAAALLRALSAVLVSAGVGSVLGACSALLCAPLLSNERLRHLVPYLSGALASIWVGIYLTSVGLRALSGTYLSFSAIEFGLNGNAHLLDAALESFQLPLIGVAVTSVGLGVLSSWATRRYLRGGDRRPRLRAPAFVAGLSLVPVYLSEDLPSASPELSLASSFMSPLARSDDDTTPDTVGKPLLGAALEAADTWTKRAQSVKAGKPNILLTVLESVPERRLGYAGNTRKPTPNIDRLALEGVRFRRVWATATHSNYAQMALLSSLFPRRGAGLDVYKHIDYPRVLLHDLTAQLGYETAAISSQDERWQGMLRFQDTGTPIYRWHAVNHPGPHLDIGSELAVPDHLTTDHALSWLGHRTGRRWALTLTFQATHFPYRLPAGQAQPFEPNVPAKGTFNYLRYPQSETAVAKNRFDNALAYVDAQIGRVRAFLDATGQLADTLWIVTSDHGEMFHEHDSVTHGKTLYDAEARVPLIIHWPKALEAREVLDPVSHLDVVPTLLDLLELPPHPALQGASVFDKSEERRPRSIYMNIQGLRTVEALVCYPWKVIVDRSAQRVRLFDLEADPDETRDLAKEHLRVAESMRAALHAQMRAQHAYHGKDDSMRRAFFAPRMLPCPAEVSGKAPARGVAQSRAEGSPDQAHEKPVTAVGTRRTPDDG
ncbi:MAG: sulfatase [Polyangiaceae bacterium]